MPGRARHDGEGQSWLDESRANRQETIDCSHRNINSVLPPSRGERICFEMIIRLLHFPWTRGYLAGEGIARGKKMLSADLQIFADYQPARWLQNRIPQIPMARSAASAGGNVFREHFSAPEKHYQSTKARRLWEIPGQARNEGVKPGMTEEVRPGMKGTYDRGVIPG